MDRRIRLVVDLLDTRWKEGICIADLASRVGLGVSRLEHLFKLNARTSIRDFVRERRLREAALLLATTEERISTISYGVGYGDVSNFNHAFKRRFGVSPREYRERAHDENETVLTAQAGQGSSR